MTFSWAAAVITKNRAQHEPKIKAKTDKQLCENLILFILMLPDEYLLRLSCCNDLTYLTFLKVVFPET